MNSVSWIANPVWRNEGLLNSGMVVVMLLFLTGGFIARGRIAQSVSAIATDREDCISLCRSEPELIAALDLLQSQYADLEHDFGTILARIPKRVVDSEVLSFIRGLAQTTHCSLIDFRPNSIQKQKDFQTRSFELRLDGGFKNVFQFFESMRNVPFVYQVGRFKIAEPSSPGGACHLDLELKVVFDHVWAQTE